MISRSQVLAALLLPRIQVLEADVQAARTRLDAALRRYNQLR